jgi:hypothetical protein
MPPPSLYRKHFEAADENIREANELLANPGPGTPEEAQTKATLAVANATLAVACARSAPHTEGMAAEDLRLMP